ncbi:Predicted anti-sigma-YlaC factor YlaD, contains Zn-finger domain [Asanoa ishikariensis]|uniref:Predicted anti-sigma-YlaC factor YlaD, contains Zn-finger domain n=2 Tax=Asanoa ishikariensis TaxID=137265 RepID=A0A1H3TS81_9ACTN|nr:Predicted anti-sigma-YlaC factor YlaD, contains Zn-finger domain [Asanoa ishikariensis]
MLSARLDGEDAPGERELTELHLAGCKHCAAWLDAAAVVTRLARTAPVPQAKPIEVDLVSAAPKSKPKPQPNPQSQPQRGRPRLAIGLRLGLAAIGAVQFLLGAAQVAGLGRDDHAHDAALGSGHLWHESAAWNLAIGAGFAFVALHRTRPTGMLPTLTAFVGVLTLLSANDIIAGRVEPGRLASHGFLIAGWLITLALSRPALDPGEPPARGTRRWTASFDPEPATAPPRLRLVERRATVGAPVTAQHRSEAA